VTIERDETSDTQAIERLHESFGQLRRELGKVIVGQEAVIEQLLVALLAGGHCLLVGVPGLAKTLLVRSLAECLSLQFSRIQFTPDLMPADITGTELIEMDRETGAREFRFVRGPIFANVVLADEINRTPPKTQAALLEAMQEHQATVAGTQYRLPEPFFVLATQNPIEQEGTYPLPEAQVDRFLLQVQVDYPKELEELRIVKQTTCDYRPQLVPTLTADEIQGFVALVRRVPIADHLAMYALRLARHTRTGQAEAPPRISQYVRWGAGPRASQALVLGAKARAALEGRFCVEVGDIRAVAQCVLRHRLITNFHADADGVSSDDLIEELLETTSLNG
jgi:MoxR-like ATPase